MTAWRGTSTLLSIDSIERTRPTSPPRDTVKSLAVNPGTGSFLESSTVTSALPSPRLRSIVTVASDRVVPICTPCARAMAAHPARATRKTAMRLINMASLPPSGPPLGPARSKSPFAGAGRSADDARARRSCGSYDLAQPLPAPAVPFDSDAPTPKFICPASRRPGQRHSLPARGGLYETLRNRPACPRSCLDRAHRCVGRRDERGPGHLRPLHRYGQRCLLRLHPRGVLPGDHDGDDADDLRPGGQRDADADGGVPVADGGPDSAARQPACGLEAVLDAAEQRRPGAHDRRQRTHARRIRRGG